MTPGGTRLIRPTRKSGVFVNEGVGRATYGRLFLLAESERPRPKGADCLNGMGQESPYSLLEWVLWRTEEAMTLVVVKVRGGRKTHD